MRHLPSSNSRRCHRPLHPELDRGHGPGTPGATRFRLERGLPLPDRRTAGTRKLFGSTELLALWLIGCSISADAFLPGGAPGARLQFPQALTPRARRPQRRARARRARRRGGRGWARRRARARGTARRRPRSFPRQPPRCKGIALSGLMLASVALIANAVVAGDPAAERADTLAWSFGIGTTGFAVAKLGIAATLIGILVRLWLRVESVKAALPELRAPAEGGAAAYGGIETPYGPATATERAPKPLLISTGSARSSGKEGRA